MSSLRRVAILGGVRIPFCRNNTAYFDVGNLGLSTIVLGGLVEKFQLQGQTLGEVAMGAVLKHSSDFNLSREATLSSGLSPYTPGITLQRACGTGLDSLITVANKIAVGQIEVGAGGGRSRRDGQAQRAEGLQALRGNRPQRFLSRHGGEEQPFAHEHHLQAA